MLLTIFFALLRPVWQGFVYFSLSFLILLCIFGIVIFSLKYIEDYYKSFDNDFKEFKAETINFTNITSLEFDENIKFYIKKFKKSLLQDKLIDIFKILFLLAMIVVCIVTMIKIWFKRLLFAIILITNTLNNIKLLAKKLRMC